MRDRYVEKGRVCKSNRTNKYKKKHEKPTRNSLTIVATNRVPPCDIHVQPTHQPTE